MTNPTLNNNNNSNNNHLANGQAQSTKPKEARIAAGKRAIKNQFGKGQVPFLVVNQGDRQIEKAFGFKPLHFKPGNRPSEGEERDSLKENPARQLWNDLRNDMNSLVKHHILSQPDWMRLLDTNSIPAVLRMKCINAIANNYPDLFYIKDGQGEITERFQYHFVIEWLFVDSHTILTRDVKSDIKYDKRKRRDDDYEYLYKKQRGDNSKRQQQANETERNPSPAAADKENLTTNIDKQAGDNDSNGNKQLPNLSQQSSGNVSAQPAQVTGCPPTQNNNVEIYNSDAENSAEKSQTNYEYIDGMSSVDVSFMANLLNTPTNSFSMSAPNNQSTGELNPSSFGVDDSALPSSQPAAAPASSPLLANQPSSSQPLLNPDGSFYAPTIHGFHAITPQQSAASLQASRSFVPATLGENTPNSHAVWANIIRGIEHGNPASVPLQSQTPTQASQQEKRANEGIHNGNAQKRTRNQQQQQPPATLPPATAVTSSFTN